MKFSEIMEQSTMLPGTEQPFIITEKTITSAKAVQYVKNFVKKNTPYRYGEMFVAHVKQMWHVFVYHPSINGLDRDAPGWAAMTLYAGKDDIDFNKDVSSMLHAYAPVQARRHPNFPC